MQELWKQVPGCEYLEVSNLGRVRRNEVYHTVPNRYGGYHVRHEKEKILTPTDNGHGYKIVSTRIVNKKRNYYVHRLVAMAFVSGYREGLVVNHKNYDTSDNRAENLEWTTQKENVHKSQEHMRKPRASCRPTNTGEKYISYTRVKGCKDKMYKVRSGRYFKTLEEAVKYRNEVMGW